MMLVLAEGRQQKLQLKKVRMLFWKKYKIFLAETDHELVLQDVNRTSFSYPDNSSQVQNFNLCTRRVYPVRLRQNLMFASSCYSFIIQV